MRETIAICAVTKPMKHTWSVGARANAYTRMMKDCGREEVAKNEMCIRDRFETAWSNPEPIMLKLSEMYPEATIEHWWADEDMGSNDGYRVYRGGKIVEGDSVSYTHLRIGTRMYGRAGI